MAQITVVVIAVFVLLDFAAISSGFEYPPPPLIKCHIHDEKCWADQTQLYLKTYKNGIPELNIKSIDPMDIDDFEIKGNDNSPSSVNLAISDMKLYNLTATEVLGVKVLATDPSKPLKTQTIFFTPQSTFKSKYKINGKILILPIRGEGDFTLQLFNVTVKINSIIRFEKRQDEKFYIKDIDIKISSKADDAKIHLSNLFNGDKELSDNMLKVLNDNWKILHADFDPEIHKSLAKQTVNALKILLKDVPYEDLFLKA